MNMCKNRHEAGIVYTATRKEADRIYERLKRNQIRAGRYHGGLADDVRKEQQERFLNDELQVMVATSAFGMGIDKSNIRFVLHAQIQKIWKAIIKRLDELGGTVLPVNVFSFFTAGYYGAALLN